MALIYYKHKNGTTYVYDSINYWDKVKKQSRSKRTCIGKLDDNGKILYSRRFTKAIPDSVPTAKSEETPPVMLSRRLFYGATYLLDQIGDKLGITVDLKTCFPSTWRQLLSIVYYLILDNSGALLNFAKWESIHYHPYGQNISSQRSSEILQDIQEGDKNRFLKLQRERRDDNEFLAYDISTISSYSETLRQVQYGKNKEHDSLPQFNLALIYGQKTNLPYYFRKLAGNIPDVSTLRTLITDLNSLGFDRLKIVLDRGFYSAANIDALYEAQLEFLLAASTSLNTVKKALDTVYDELDLYKYYDENHCLYATTVQTIWNHSNDKGIIENHPLYIHLFYNAEKTAADRVALETEIAKLRRELLENKMIPEHSARYKKYFTVKDNSQGEKEIVVKDEAIRKARRYYGYFALISNIKLDAITALETYRNRDLVEKAFGNLKDRLNLRRALTSSEQGLNGKLFVEYVALIYLSYIKKQMQTNNIFKDYTLQQVLDRLDVIECFETASDTLRIGEVLQKQRDLYKKLGVTPPKPYTETSL